MADTSSSSSSSSRRRRGSSSSKPSGSSSSPSSGDKSSSMGFLGKKIGPVPIWLIGLGLFGLYYWYTHYGPGAKQNKTSGQQGQQRRGRGGGTRVIVVRDGGGGRGRGRKHHKAKGSPRAAAAPSGGNVGGGMTAEATAPYMTDTAPPGPTGGAVTEGGAPVYAAYQQFYGAQGGDGDSAAVPDPMTAYAPMTAGAIYAGPDYG